MFEGDSLLFVPVVVLLAIILIALSFRVLFRLLVILLIIAGIWYFFSGRPVEKPVKQIQKNQVHKNV